MVLRPSLAWAVLFAAWAHALRRIDHAELLGRPSSAAPLPGAPAADSAPAAPTASASLLALSVRADAAAAAVAPSPAVPLAFVAPSAKSIGAFAAAPAGDAAHRIPDLASAVVAPLAARGSGIGAWGAAAPSAKRDLSLAASVFHGDLFSLGDRDGQERLDRVDVEGWCGGREAYELPQGWAARLEPGSLREVRPSDGEHHGAVLVGRLAGNRFVRVALKIGMSQSEHTRREVRTAKRVELFRNLHVSFEGDSEAAPAAVPPDGAVPRTSSVLSTFEIVEAGGRAYTMSEAGDRDLETQLRSLQLPGEESDYRLEQASMSPETSAGKQLSASFALPVLLDLLRACRELEAAGIVHSDLSAENVLVVRGRAVLGGLGACCLLHVDEGPGTTCADLRDSLGHPVGSVFSQAPEVEDGIPAGPSSHVWGLGVLLARMSVGYDPVMWFVHQETEDDLKLLGLGRRKEVRGIIRQAFDVEAIPRFGALPQEVQGLLRGMLAKDPNARWNTAVALRQVEEAMISLSLPVSPERALPAPPQWASMPAAWRVGLSPDGVLRPEMVAGMKPWQ